LEKELIQQARSSDLAGFLMSVGVPLVRVGGGRFRHVEHGSLVFTGNAYFWNSRGESGNAVDYLVRHLNFAFKDAVFALAGFRGAEGETCGERGNFALSALSVVEDGAKVRAYLSQTRHISHSIIDYLIENKLLYQEIQTNNAIFVMYDERDDYVGAEMRGVLPDKPFKGVKGGSKYGYGFNVRFGENDFDYALFFESAVDLISFMDYKLHYEQKSLNKCILISMAGLKINVLRHTLKVFNGNLKAVLCVDNDEAGQAFQNKVENEKIPFIVCCPDEKFKDWNEQLAEIKGQKTIEILPNYSKIR